MIPQPRHCKDCPPECKRPTVPGYPGPRCATHARAHKKRAKALAHERGIFNGYEMSPEQYQRLYDFQGGRCFVCRKATGATKRLAVEHSHDCDAGHPPEKGCPKCWRALTCGRCNRLVAFLDVEALCRAIELLVDPPARKVLRNG